MLALYVSAEKSESKLLSFLCHLVVICVHGLFNLSGWELFICWAQTAWHAKAQGKRRGVRLYARRNKSRLRFAERQNLACRRNVTNTTTEEVKDESNLPEFISGRF